MCFDVGFVTCAPNEAMVISGIFHSPPTVIRGGRALVCPCIQVIQRLPLTTMTVVIDTPKVYTNQGVAISVVGVAQVKCNSEHPEMLSAAAAQFGSMSLHQISNGMFHSYFGKLYLRTIKQDKGNELLQNKLRRKGSILRYDIYHHII